MKQDRIALRTSQKEREHLLEAAMFTGMTLSGFLRQAALEKADEALKNRDNLTLSNRDRDIFLDALENPPKMNKHLQQAFAEYEKRKKGNSSLISPVRRSRPKTKKTKAIVSKKG